MVKENISQAFTLKGVSKAKKDFIEEVKQNEFTIKKHKKVYIAF